jgi:hypothetical protein
MITSLTTCLIIIFILWFFTVMKLAWRERHMNIMKFRWECYREFMVKRYGEESDTFRFTCPYLRDIDEEMKEWPKSE